MIKDFVFTEGEVPFFESRLLKRFGVRHAFFTRIGGVSKGVFDSLNFAVGAGHVKDEESSVLANYGIAAGVFGLTASDVCRSYQTHTSEVVWVDESHRGVGTSKPPFDRGIDGLITRTRDLLLSVRTADCVPIILCDKSKTVCSAVHAGWRGTLGGIGVRAIEMMADSGIKKEDILVAIGPCIGQCCYEVGQEVFDLFVLQNKDFLRFFEPNDTKYMLDLSGLNSFCFESAGVPAKNISVCGICTKENGDLFFSHRRDGVNRGTMSCFVTL